jgi:MFS family permease
MDKAQRRRFIPVAFLTFVNTIGFTILIPVLPFVVDYYNENAFSYGLLLSAYALFQFLFAPLMGSLSDKYGRRPILLLSQGGTLLSWMLFGMAYFVPNFQVWGYSFPLLVILLSRIVDGITGGNMSVAQAYMADISKGMDRVKLYSYNGAVFGLGFLLGPVIGGYTSTTKYGYMGTVVVAGTISLVTLLIIYHLLDESLPKEKRDADLEIHYTNELNMFKKLREFTGNKIVNDMFIRHAFFGFGFACFTTTFTLYLKGHMGLGAFDIGLVLLIVGISAVLNQIFVVPFMSKRYGTRLTFHVGQAFLFFSIASVFFKPKLFLFGALMFTVNLGMVLSMPTLKSIITDAVDETKQGRVTGIDESIWAGAQGLAPILAAFAYDKIFTSSFLIFAAFILVPYFLLGLGPSKLNKE